MSSRKLPVAINVFPTLDYVELVQYDDKTGEIDKASVLPCRLDPVSRQVVDWEHMGQTIRDLFSMNRIVPGTPAVLVLPSFFTREIELPIEFSKDELRFALVSEAERFYIFKKAEPQIDWVNLDEGHLLYSAYPKSEIEKYVQLFQENHIPLMGIELNYFSILRALTATGAVSDEIESQSRWCLLVISDYSFFSSIQEGVRIIKTTDAPLSSSEDGESSAVQEIQQDFESFTEPEIFTKLIVVNNASRIRSEDLLSRFNFGGELVLIEQNGTTLRSRGSEDANFPCSLEGIGGVFYSEFQELSRLNLLPETSEDVAGILHFRKAALKYLAIINAGTFVLCLALWGLLSLMLWQKDQEIQSLSKQVVSLASSSDTKHMQELSRKRFVKKSVEQNIQLNNLMVNLGRLAPSNTWLEKIELDTSDINLPVQVKLEGKSLKLDEVNNLNAELGKGFPDVNLEVSNAAPVTSPDGQSYYTWSIQNKVVEAAQSGNSQPGFGNSMRPGRGSPR